MNIKSCCVFNASEGSAEIRSIFKISPPGKSHDDAKEVKVHTINLDYRTIGTCLFEKAQDSFRIVTESEQSKIWSRLLANII